MTDTPELNVWTFEGCSMPSEIRGAEYAKGYQAAIDDVVEHLRRVIAAHKVEAVNLAKAGHDGQRHADIAISLRNATDVIADAFGKGQ